jgi:hypothetical protein
VVLLGLAFSLVLYGPLISLEDWEVQSHRGDEAIVNPSCHVIGSLGGLAVCGAIVLSIRYLFLLWIWSPLIFGSPAVKIDCYVAELESGRLNPYYCAQQIGLLGAPGVKWLLSNKWPRIISDKICVSEEAQADLSAFGLLSAPCDVFPYLEPMLTNTNAYTRAFAASMWRLHGDDRIVKLVKRLTEDKTSLPTNTLFGYSSQDETVSRIANRSLMSSRGLQKVDLREK